MRVTMNIECTPEEARAFFGAPDVKPIQDAMMQKMQDQFTASMKLMDPADAMRQWQEMSIQNFKAFQQLFWSEATQGAQAATQEPQKKAG